jgi:hypothetical protein
MRRRVQRPPAATRVMRSGKTKRDRASGAWENHRQNKEWRRFEGKQIPEVPR